MDDYTIQELSEIDNCIKHGFSEIDIDIFPIFSEINNGTQQGYSEIKTIH